MALSKKLTPRFRNYALITLVVIMVAVVIAVSKLLHSQQETITHQTQPEATPIPTLTITSRTLNTGEGSYAIATEVPNQMRFVSPKLGISFLYQDKYGDGKDAEYINVLEHGNRFTYMILSSNHTQRVSL
jgi:hypothetical protein